MIRLILWNQFFCSIWFFVFYVYPSYKSKFWILFMVSRCGFRSCGGLFTGFWCFRVRLLLFGVWGSPLGVCLAWSTIYILFFYIFWKKVIYNSNTPSPRWKPSTKRKANTRRKPPRRESIRERKTRQDIGSNDKHIKYLYIYPRSRPILRLSA